jgi:hypothetical protein
MLLEKSFQAQALIPMATSLAFGLIASTLLVLLMVPLLYRLYVAVSFTDEQMLGFDPLAKESSTRLQEPIPVHHGEQLVSAARA